MRCCEPKVGEALVNIVSLYNRVSNNGTYPIVPSINSWPGQCREVPNKVKQFYLEPGSAGKGQRKAGQGKRKQGKAGKIRLLRGRARHLLCSALLK